MSQITAEEGNIPASSHCTLKKMTITCKVLEGWPIVIERTEGIRCIDVFRAIYDTFSQPLTMEEVRRFCAERDSRGNIKYIRAFKVRCADSPGLTEFNEKKGLLRVDLLNGHRRFKGIKQCGADWELMIDLS